MKVILRTFNLFWILISLAKVNLRQTSSPPPLPPLLILDKFFLKYERGGRVKLTPPLPPGKTTLKKPSLIRSKFHLASYLVYVLRRKQNFQEKILQFYWSRITLWFFLRAKMYLRNHESFKSWKCVIKCSLIFTY